ncbi:MAG: energy-coupling factor transporter transmembrane protein EcfT, partial [Moorella sp. (in: Bacteria)]|nr:energy-coupling factor transporter transmembrane protein EcfT [Moorella sp. (in: firmicutes)]
MLEGITFGQYIPGQSVIHRLDPRTKIFCALVFVAATLLARSWAAYALLTGLALFFICLSRVPWRLVGKTLKPFWPIIILTFLLQVFFTPGQAVFCTGVFQVTAEGIEAGGQLFWRLTVIVIVTSLLTLTTSPLDLTAAVEGLL